MRSFVVPLVLSCFAANSQGCKGTTSSASATDAGELEDAGTGHGGVEAMRQTVATNPLCTSLGDLYWSVGDREGRIGSGQIGTSFDADTRMAIFSASKLVFASYVVERQDGVLSAPLVAGLNFTSGYVEPGLKLCKPEDTVGSCFDNELDVFQPGKVGTFNYASGHMQRIAALPEHLDLYDLDRQGFASEIMRELGPEIEVEFKVEVTIANVTFTAGPLAAGGMHTSASAYESYLRKMVAGDLLMLSHLGTESVPTGIPNIDYSLGHWIEKNADSSVDAYSSVGALGFYPWIDGSKQYWGVLARLETDENRTADAAGASQLCGAQMRKAFTTGQAQL